MSRSLWRCQNRECPVPHGAELGRVTIDGGLALDPAVTTFRCYLDTRRVAVACPACGTEREYRGPMLVSARRGRATATNR
jgi:hypothetical protein